MVTDPGTTRGTLGLTNDQIGTAGQLAVPDMATDWRRNPGLMAAMYRPTPRLGYVLMV